MKKILLSLLSFCFVAAQAQITVNSAKVPAYMQGVNGTNNSRTPFWFWAELTGLTPNAKYRFYTSIDTLNASATSNGAGNPLLINMTSGTVRRTTSISLSNPAGCDSLFADASGNYKGWFGVEPTGNGRFAPGKTVYPKLILNNGAGGTTVANRVLLSAYPVTVINFGTNSGAAIEGSAIFDSIANNSVPAKSFVFVYDNNAASGRPVSAAIVENDGLILTAVTSIAAFYKDSVDGRSYRWGTIIPNNLAAGLNMVEVVDFANTSVLQTYSLTNNDGQWCSLNTVNPSNGSSPVFLHAFAQTPTLTAALDNMVICEGLSAVLSTTTSASSISINPGNLSTMSETISPTTTTDYTITANASYGCTNTTVITLSVNPAPTLSVSLVNNKICAGDNAIFSLSSNESNPSFTVNPGNLNGDSYTLTPTSDITYTASITGINGCSTSADISIMVSPLPTASVSIDNGIVCEGMPAIITISTSDPTPSYTLNPGALTGDTHTVTPSASTTYTAMVASVNGCANSATIALTVNPLPVINVTSSNTLLCTGETATLSVSGADTYTWSSGENTTDVIVTLTTTTTYTVYGIDNNSCENNTVFTQSVSVCTGITEQLSNQISVYPNPGSGKFTISAINSNYDNGVIYNQLGEIVLEKKLDTSSSHIDTNLPSGIYYLQLNGKGTTSGLIKLVITN